MNAIQIVQSAIGQAKPHFDNENNVLQFSTEEHFAIQMLSANEYSMKIAQQNQFSLQNAMRNVANIGLSLNPANSHAYLVPRRGEICLDISYTGLIALATQSGAIDFVSVEVVYENEQFTVNGHNHAPTHVYDPFNRQGEIRGTYCVTQLSKGGVMVSTMSRKDIDEIRALSPGSSKPDSPWNTFYAEMCKKVVIKRASKTWPQPSQRLKNAISYLNHDGGEGIELKREKVVNDGVSQSKPVSQANGKLSLSREKIDKLVHMAFEKNRVENARKYFQDNIIGEDLDYALNKLTVN